MACMWAITTNSAYYFTKGIVEWFPPLDWMPGYPLILDSIEYFEYYKLGEYFH